ncbi:hypothetical protein OQA88_7925 [Cercophora sp. LCS_1]
MTASKDYRFVLFGGQGSPSIFSPGASATAEADAKSTQVGTILLSKCHAAFLEEIASLDQGSKDVLAIDTTHFTSPLDLLKPLEKYYTHPVLEATTIYLCQSLHYLAESHRHGQSFHDFFLGIEETSGFSSGLLPATVVARSPTEDDFVSSGVAAFRLTFWIGLRTFFWEIKAISHGQDVANTDPEATLSLVVRGLSKTEVQERLSQNVARHPTLQVSATSSSGVVSVSGTKTDLCVFKSHTVSDVPTAFAYAYGWYHGGDQLEGVVQQVLEDSRRRAIVFSPCSTPHTIPTRSVRSTLDGMRFGIITFTSEELVEWLTRHLLVHCVDWQLTSQGLGTQIHSMLEQEPRSTVKILSFGPSSGTLFPESQSLDPRVELVDLSSFKAASRQLHGLLPEHRNSIAIVGMSVNLPRGKGTEELWETLAQGLNAVQEIPESRFDISDYYASESDNPRTMAARHGAFIDDPFSFDNAFFNISPREARSMDPQQRILLHAAQEAFEDAGYVADSSPSFQRASTGCYIGLATGDYTANLKKDIDVFYSSGTLRAFHSGRISYFYKLSGPSIVTDTACSASTVSIYQACRALQNGDCSAALAGGVNVITGPDMYLGLARGHFLSQTGGCKPFDASADGYCRAEGCVLFVLKRLSDAVAEGDRIHGVIRDMVINQSGNSHSITHPHSQTQTSLLTRLFEQTKIGPGSVSVVEAHGTGTQAGDGREVESLKTVFGPHHSTANPIMISSIKGNVGHCEAASGAAGLAKLLLMLREKKIPMQAGLWELNPSFSELENKGIIIPRHTMPWNNSQRNPRRAVLNNFGAAGSNASLLLEDWVGPLSARSKNRERSAYVFSLSAKSERALQWAVDQHIGVLQRAKTQPSLRDICYTATARRQAYDHRISFSCSSFDDLLSQLQQSRTLKSRPVAKVTGVVFVFSGQGALYQGMGDELMTSSPSFRETMFKCDKIVRGLGFPRILDKVGGETAKSASSHTEEIITSQCACVALEIALARMFTSWGITPDYMMGHSLGEYAALCISGALTLEDTLQIVAFRAEMMADNCLPNTSGMLACNLSPEKADVLLSGNPTLSQLTVACRNSTTDCVVAGPLEHINALHQLCRDQKVRAKILDVPYAFHTSAMDPILESLDVMGQSVKFKTPTIPVLSNVYGRFFEQDDFNGHYFSLHARQPVRFSDCLQHVSRKKDLDGTVFVEIGPHPTTLPMLRASLASKSCTYLGTLKKGKEAWTSISETLAANYLINTPTKWREVFAGTSARVTSLPGHLLEGQTFLVPFEESPRMIDHMDRHSPALESRVKTGFSLLPWRSKKTSTDKESAFESELGILEPLILGHDVGGSPICPASVFHELALEAADAVLEPSPTQVLVVTNMGFANPLIYASSKERDIVIVRIIKTEQGFEFKISSRPIESLVETTHCAGAISTHILGAPTWTRDQALVARQSRHFSSPGSSQMSTFRTKVLYEAIFTRVVRYSSDYQTLAHLSVADSNLEGLGLFALPSGPRSDYITHPVFTDTLLHAAGFIANLAVRSDQICICTQVESIELAYRSIDYSETFTIYCSLLETKNALLADAIALGPSGKVVAVTRGIEFKILRLISFQQALNSHTPSPPKPEISPPSTLMGTPPSATNTPAEPQPSSPLPNISQTIKSIVVQVGGFTESDIDPSKTLDELGIDSLMRIEMVAKLARTFPGQAGLNHHALAECETIEALEEMLSSVLQPVWESPSPAEPANPLPVSHHIVANPVLLHSGKPGLPLVLFHDGSGQAAPYTKLSGHERDVYAFFDPFFGGDHGPITSVNDMALRYADNLSKDLNSPLILGGWSFGGVLAFEAAHILIGRGFDVKGLVLIDSPGPANHKPLPAEVVRKIAKGGGKALEDEFLFSAGLLGKYKPRSFGRAVKTVMLKSKEVFDTEGLCGVRYDWLEREEKRVEFISQWEGLVGGRVKVLEIPGNHFEAFNKENVDDTARMMWEACRFIEGI